MPLGRRLVFFASLGPLLLGLCRTRDIGFVWAIMLSVELDASSSRQNPVVERYGKSDCAFLEGVRYLVYQCCA